MIEEVLREILASKDDYKYGFADLNGFLSCTYSGYRYGIVLVRKLDDRIIDFIHHGPTLAYLDHYRSVNRELSDISEEIATRLREEGVSVQPIAPTLKEKDHTQEYMRTLRLDFSHKLVATRAGLGWIGKTALFISREWGPRVRLVSLLTNYPMKMTGKPIEKSDCGTCNICVEQCPAKAATGQLWEPGLDRDIFYDAFKCRQTCLSFKISNSPICGICVAVCPIGRTNRKP